MPSALPILLLGGAALLLMGGKKKTRPAEEMADDSLEDSLEEPEELPTTTLQVSERLIDKCNNFMDAVWTEPEEDAIAIKDVVAEESILPEMRSAANDKRLQVGKDLSTDFAHSLVMIGFNAVAPGCNWSLTSHGWRYADGQPFEGRVLDVYEGMNELALMVIDETNNAPGDTLQFDPGEEPDDEVVDPVFDIHPAGKQKASMSEG